MKELKELFQIWMLEEKSFEFFQMWGEKFNVVDATTPLKTKICEKCGYTVTGNEVRCLVGKDSQCPYFKYGNQTIRERSKTIPEIEKEQRDKGSV